MPRSRPPPDADAALFPDLLDSISLLELIDGIAEELGVDVSDLDLMTKAFGSISPRGG